MCTLMYGVFCLLLLIVYWHPTLLETRNEKHNEKQEWYEKWSLQFLHTRNEERETTTLKMKKSWKISLWYATFLFILSKITQYCNEQNQS